MSRQVLPTLVWLPARAGHATLLSGVRRANLAPQTKALVIGKYRYRADIGSKAGWVTETGPKGKKKNYPLLHALGGKNVYYFLTPLARGRLQTLPVAYDVRTKQWFDTAASGVRHFGSGPPEEPVHWKEWPYTFNTACFNCHVSQLSSNYDLKTDTYRTTWAEPGINCEACRAQALQEALHQGGEFGKTTDAKRAGGGKIRPEVKQLRQGLGSFGGSPQPA